jgi:hypothetical protein
MCFRIMRVAVFVFAAMIAVRPVWAGCSNASLSGAYGYFHGRPSGAAGARVVVGQIIADGKGSVSGSWTMSLNGALSNGALTGTYSIAKNCTGTLTMNNEDFSPADFAIVIDDGHHGFQMLQTDSGTAQPGFAVAQGNATCGLTGKKQVLATNLLGTAYPSTDIVAIVGQVTLDGKGNITGSGTFSVGGVISSNAVRGTYAVNGNCTGTVQIVPNGGSPLNFNSVVVEGGKQVLLIESDNNTTVSGEVQE